MIAYPVFNKAQREAFQSALETKAWVLRRPGVCHRQAVVFGIRFVQWDFFCQDCKTHDLDGFMVHDALWRSLCLKGVICLSCFENRLGRKITKADLMRVPINRHLLLDLSE